jgi:cardiolipin synthase A/B
MSPSLSASWLASVDEAYRQMLAALATARTSVRLEIYIFKPGEPGDLFRDALVAAALRRVKVRVLLDGFGSNELPPDYWRALEEAGGAAGVFNPLALDRLVIRNHRKLLVVDDETAFVGGFNIAPEYVGDGVTRGWRDLGIVLSGTVVRCLAASFDAMWAYREFLHPHGIRLRQSRLRRRLRDSGSADVMATGPGIGRNGFRLALRQALQSARDVRIVSSYFLPGFRLRRALQRVARHGGRVQLILAGKSDVSLAQAAGRALYRPLLRAGVEIFEYQPQILHAKLAIVDDTVFVGSANLDARSLGINYELMVRIADPALAEQGRALFAADQAHSRPITLAAWQQSQTWATRWHGIVARFLLTKIDPWLARRQLRRLT